MHVVFICQELGVDESRLVVSYDQVNTQFATVSVLPQEQTMTSDDSIDKVINRALLCLSYIVVVVVVVVVVV